VETVLAWADGIPLGVLYLLIFLSAVAEGLIPVLPGDVIAALLAFIAARSGGALVLTAGLVTIGSVTGALGKWWLGRRFGAAWLSERMEQSGYRRSGSGFWGAEAKVEAAYRRFGWTALFASRLVPGIRAVVPAAAGALRIPFWEVALLFTAASSIWYGSIVWVAFRVGSDWATVQARLELVLRDVGSVAAVLFLLLGIGFWRWRRQRRSP
jgi:membrane protein DedA with SNARE-associated domain